MGAPISIPLWDVRDGYLWVPRYFARNVMNAGAIPGIMPNFLSRISPTDKDATDGAAYEFDTTKIALRADRGQPDAFSNMRDILNTDGGGVLIAPTGNGKTITGYAIAASFNRFIGVLVYNEQMLKNWRENAAQWLNLAPDQIGVVQGDQCDLGCPVTIMMVQSLYSRSYDPALYAQIGFIIADEVHRYAAQEFHATVAQFPGCYRMGMSADPHRQDGLDLAITWNFGPTRYLVPAKHKKAKPQVVQVRYHSKRYDIDSTLFRFGQRRGEVSAMLYQKILEQDEDRNMMMVREMVKARRQNRCALVFSRFRDHARHLHELFTKEWQADQILNGPSSHEETRATIMMGGTKDLDTAMAGHFIFTTYSFSKEALNIPALDTLFFCLPSGNPLQSVGRLRDIGPEDKKDLLVVDFYENNEYSEGRAARRRRDYANLRLPVTDAKRVYKPANAV